jgi:hypothetical protein
MRFPVVSETSSGDLGAGVQMIRTSGRRAILSSAAGTRTRSQRPVIAASWPLAAAREAMTLFERVEGDAPGSGVVGTVSETTGNLT